MTGLLRRLRCRLLGHSWRWITNAYWCVECLEPMPPSRSS